MSSTSGEGQRRKPKTLVLKEQRIVIIFCSRISQCRMSKCSTQKTYDKKGFNTFCVSLSNYDEERAILSVENLLKRIESLSS